MQNNSLINQDQESSGEYFLTGLKNRSASRVFLLKENGPKYISARPDVYFSAPGTSSNSQFEAESPSLIRTVKKVSCVRPKSAFQNVRTMRFGDSIAYTQKTSSIRKFLKPDENMLLKLKELTNDRKSVQMTLDNLFYVQKKKMGKMEIDQDILINYSLREACLKKLKDLQRQSAKKAVTEKVYKKNSSENILLRDDKNDRSNKYLKFKKKDKPLELLKLYTTTQKETIDIWRATQEEGKNISNVMITLFPKDNPVQKILDSEKYKNMWQSKPKVPALDSPSKTKDFRRFKTAKTRDF